MDNVRSNHLEELKGSDFQIMDGMPDIQGWEIEDFQGEKVGKVRDMLFDKNTRKVRYIITKLEGDDQEVLIPIGKAQLEVSESKVTIQGRTFDQLVGLPTYIKGEVTTDDEYAIQNIFQRHGSEEVSTITDDTVYDRDTFYDNESFNSERFHPNLGEDRTGTGTSSDQDVGGGDIDTTDDSDQTDRPNERRGSLGDDDGPIDGDINNPLIH